MAVAAMSRHAMRLECSQAQLDVGIGRAIVEQAERLGDYEATRYRSHKRNGDGFTGEFNSAALVESRSNVRLVLLRNTFLIGLALPLLFLREVGPEFIDAAGIG